MLVTSSRLYRFALSEIVFHQYTHLGVLDMSAGNVLGQVELAIRVCFRIRPCLGCVVRERVPLAENSSIKPLAWFPAQESVWCLFILPMFSRCLGLGTKIRRRQGYELSSLPWGCRMGPKASMVCHLGTCVRQDCVLNSLATGFCSAWVEMQN